MEPPRGLPHSSMQASTRAWPYPARPRGRLLDGEIIDNAISFDLRLQ